MAQPADFVITKSDKQAVPFHEPSTSWPDACERCGYGVPCDVSSEGKRICARCSHTLTSTIRTHTGQQRNKPCKCGSGKKYKHCCAKKHK